MKRGINLAAGLAALFALVLGGSWLTAQWRSLPGRGPLAARADQRVVTLEVSGMTCSACEERIRGALAATPGVTACEVRRAQDRAYVVCARATADSAIVHAVERAGPGYLAGVVGK